MSNPLLKPNDPRFVRPTITDEAGHNRFADGANGATPPAPASDNLFAAGSDAASAERPYQPRYETLAPARGVWLLVAGMLGLAGAASSAASLSGVLVLGWFLPLAGTVAAATAWFLAHHDLQAMHTGAIDPSGRPLTLLAMWLGIAGLVSCLATAAAMIWLGLSLLPAGL
ncbi:MAG: hypothetical protein SFU86_21740 [Pirellulaceae bacterium]|nr:hypothetical protein [Pirellulaceae bacterium]